jgi:glycosyltransferase involved in cell wall biosynthesis
VRWLQYAVDRAVAHCTEVFLAGSRSSAARIRDVLSLGPGRALSVTNGADLRRPTETPAQTRARLGLDNFGGTIFGIVGLLEPRKGHAVLLEAFTRMVTAEHLGAGDVQLLILGNGLLRTSLERRVAELGLDRYCRFLGAEANGMHVIAALDVLVLSSLANEDFPNVVLEAMGAGKPVIASRIAGTPEQVLDGQTGLLVPAGDVAALADALTMLHGDPRRRVAMGVAGRQRYLDHFTARASVERYAECYRRLLRGDAVPADDTSAEPGMAHA